MNSKEALIYLLNMARNPRCSMIVNESGKYTKEELLNIVNKNLDKLEKINEVWHKNEPMESVDINGNHLQEVYDFIHKLSEENDKLKKVIEMLKNKLDIEIFEIQENGVTDYYLDCSGAFIDEQEEYDLLKEAFKNAK